MRWPRIVCVALAVAAGGTPALRAQAPIPAPAGPVSGAPAAPAPAPAPPAPQTVQTPPAVPVRPADKPAPAAAAAPVPQPAAPAVVRVPPQPTAPPRAPVAAGPAVAPHPAPAAAPQPAAAAPLVAPGLAQWMTTLRESRSVEQRVDAARCLAGCDGWTNPKVVQALVLSARNDPMPAVRAACLHTLGLLNVRTAAVIAAVRTLQKDPDASVRLEVDQALRLMGEY